MEVYFYCSYEHSQKGFFMTKLMDGQLVPAGSVPEKVEVFFSYDRFQALWYDLCTQENQKLFNPQPYGTFFGLRNLRGQMADGRGCTANMVIIADAYEMTALRRIALSVLGDYPAFERRLTSWLRVGGHSYELNLEAFCGWMDSCAAASRLDRFADAKSQASNLLLWMQRAEAPRMETELLRLAVYTGSWKDVREVMGQGMAWKLKPSCALSPDEFEDIFVGGAPLWALS